ncbi:MAG: DUF3047 domain-containing protein [Burkholderiales bacterium]
MKAVVLSMLLLALSAGSVGSQATERPHQQFEQELKTSVAPLAGKTVVGMKVVYLASDAGPWLDTGLALSPGDQVTMVSEGHVWLSRTFKLSFESPIAVWARIGDRGRIFRGDRTQTFTAQEAGTLQLKTYPGQRWLDATGRYAGEPAPVNPDSGGGASVAVVHWKRGTNVPDELQRIADAGPSGQWAAEEIARQQAPERSPPTGWSYLWELGPSRVFGEVTNPAGEGAPSRAIDLHTRNDVAILQTDVSIPLTPATTLAWKWKVDQLPAATRENTLPTHDYLSIAVEFDNGQDLTFLWSRGLPVGESFRCPLPGWDFRETHIVARTGTADLGKWLAERHNVFDSYRKAVGGPMPTRITKIWLIAVSLFQKTEGRGQFGEIVLSDGRRETRVYADGTPPSASAVALGRESFPDAPMPTSRRSASGRP